MINVGNILSNIKYVFNNLILYYSILIVIRIFLTWLPNVDWDKQPIKFVRIITDAYLDIFRRFVPPIGGIDFSPIVALLVLDVLMSIY